MSKENIFNSIPELQYFEEAPEVNWEEFKKVVTSRRSVRVYKKENIPDDIVRECLKMATLAPNSSNLQPWEFYWVKTKEKKEKLVKYCLGQQAAATAPVLIVCVARTQTWQRNRKLMLDLLKKQEDTPQTAIDYYEKLIPLSNGYTSPGISILKKLGIAVSGLNKVTPRVPTNSEELRTWANKTTALACQNLMLAFRAHGYDSCPMEGMDKVRIKKLLELKPDADVCMVISAGKRAPGGIYGPQIRFDDNLFIKEV